MAWNEIHSILDAFATDPSLIRRVPLTDSISYAAYHQQTNEKEHIIEVPLVGIEKNNVTVEVENNLLTVVAKTNEKSRFIRDFKQTWTLHRDADLEKMTAKLANGLLRVVIPNKTKQVNKKTVVVTEE